MRSGCSVTCWARATRSSRPSSRSRSAGSRPSPGSCRRPGPAAPSVAVQGLQQEAVAAEGDDDLGPVERRIAVAVRQPYLRVPAPRSCRQRRRRGARGVPLAYLSWCSSVVAVTLRGWRCPQPPVTLMWRATAGRVVAAVDDEVVALRLAGDRLVDRGDQRTVVVAHPHGRAQVGRVVLAQAHDRACRCRSAGRGCSFRRNYGSAA